MSNRSDIGSGSVDTATGEPNVVTGALNAVTGEGTPGGIVTMTMIITTTGGTVFTTTGVTGAAIVRV